MSVRVKTQPVEPITVSGASSVAAPEVSADIFRGVFLHLVEGTNAKTVEYLETKAVGTEDLTIEHKSSDGPSEYDVEIGGGVYGGNCLKSIQRAIPFTTDFATHNRQCNSVGHGLANGTKVVPAADFGGSLPTGITTPVNAFNGLPNWIVAATTDSFELSESKSCTASDSGGDLLLTATDHGLVDGAEVRFSDNLLPGGLAIETTYHVIADGLTSSTWKVSETSGGDPIPFTTVGTSSVFYRWDQGGVTFSSDGTGTHIVSDTGLYGHWIIRSYVGSGGTAQAFDGDDRMFAAPVAGRPYNRLELYIKYPSGYRAGKAAVASDTWNTGTYHARLGASNEEEFNYHFYYIVVHRSDLSDGAWIQLKHNECPQYQRNRTAQAPGNNPSSRISDGGFLDSMTRFYFTSTPQGQNPEITGTYNILVDRLRIFYEDPPRDIVMSWDTLDNTVTQNLTPTTQYDYLFTITNNDASSVTGKLRHACHSNLNAQILDSTLTVVGNEDDVVLPASGTWSGRFRLTPSAGSDQTYDECSVNFIPNDQFNDVASGVSAAFTDNNYRCDWDYTQYGKNLGAPDAWMWSVTLNCKRVN